MFQSKIERVGGTLVWAFFFTWIGIMLVSLAILMIYLVVSTVTGGC